jgi:hypothetical protein
MAWPSDLSASRLGTYLQVAWGCDTFAGMELAMPLRDRIVERLVAYSPLLSPSPSELASIAVSTRALTRNEKSL